MDICDNRSPFLILKIGSCILVLICSNIGQIWKLKILLHVLSWCKTNAMHEIWILASRIDVEPYYHEIQECTQGSLDLFIWADASKYVSNNISDMNNFSKYIW